MLLREGVVGQRRLDRHCHNLAAVVRRRPYSFSITRTALSRAAPMSSPAWIALSIAAISRTLVEDTWLKTLGVILRHAN
jgi:hypothetical protein